MLCCFMCIGCSSGDKEEGLINYIDAKEMIINDGAILIDVRTQEEYDENHIDGSVLLTLDNIDETTVSSIVENKDTKVIVYCQSGNRSSIAKTKLEELGYEAVYDLGSINNWEE